MATPDPVRQPKTDSGRKLLVIRERAIAKGMKLLAEQEILEEAKEEKGMSKRFVYRDAATGLFTTREYAEANPATTVCETADYPDLPDHMQHHEPLVVWGPLTGYAK